MLVRIGPQIEQLRCTQFGEGLEPNLQGARAPLLHENDLPVFRPDAQYVTVVGEIDHAATRAFLDLASEVWQQVVAVDVDLVRHIPGLVPGLELLDDIRIPSCSK